MESPVIWEHSKHPWIIPDSYVDWHISRIGFPELKYASLLHLSQSHIKLKHFLKLGLENPIRLRCRCIMDILTVNV